LLAEVFVPFSGQAQDVSSQIKRAPVGGHYDYQPIIYSVIPPDSFSFTHRWSYPPHGEKDNAGQFSKISGKINLATDTVHLYYTANCKTNIPGGPNVVY
jgi:hypothetical protein